jgi:hypothetical protein
MSTTCFSQRLPNFLACAVLAGCATSVSVTPQADGQTTTCQIHALVHYDGKPEYLPGALIDDQATPAVVAFRYTFETQYGLTEIEPFLAAVNPLTLVGFPVGADSLVVTGRVDVVRGDAIARSYAAIASMKRSSTVFSEGESFTEMRRRGLLIVRDNLSGQLCHDRALLVDMLSDANANSAPPKVETH